MDRWLEPWLEPWVEPGLSLRPFGRPLALGYGWTRGIVAITTVEVANGGPWWSNVLRMGKGLGDHFGLGLLRASGMSGTTLNVKSCLPSSDRSLAIDAVIALVRSRDSPLTSVDVSGNNLSEEEMNRIGTALLGNSHSHLAGMAADKFHLHVDDTSLDVSSMHIRPDGFVLLAGVLRASALTSLDASNNYLVTWAGHDQGGHVAVAQLCGVQAMAAAICNATRAVGCPATLRHLNLAGNTIGEAGAKAICTACADSVLETLVLRDNKLGNEGVAALLQGLEQSRLTSLDLAKNSIRVDGAVQLAASLCKMTLKRLDLSCNHLVGNHAMEATGISMGGIKALANAIVRSSTLAHVDLSSNQLCGVWDDAEAGKHGDMVGTFTAVGVNALAAALVKSSSLTSFALHHNKINVSPEAVQQLVEANKLRTKRLKYFSL